MTATESDVYHGRVISVTDECTLFVCLVGHTEIQLKISKEISKEHNLQKWDLIKYTPLKEGSSSTSGMIRVTKTYDEQRKELLEEMNDWDPSEMARLTKGLGGKIK